MSQEEVMELLKDKKARSTVEISEELGIHRNTVAHSIVRLVRREEIEIEQSTEDQRVILYRIKKIVYDQEVV